MFSRPQGSNDSIILSFAYAYRAYSDAATLADSLAVLLSFDCGATSTVLWHAGGTGLSSVPGTQTSEFLPAADQWKTMRFNLTSLIAPGQQATILFAGTNKFGQNIWLDNISISAQNPRVNDLELSLANAVPYSCNTSFPVSLKLTNKGNVIADSAVVILSNSIGNQSVKISNLKLQAGRDTTIIFPLAGQPGSFSTTAYLATPDENAGNDTARFLAQYAGNAALPYQTGFDNASASYPADWIQLASFGSPWRLSTQNGIYGTGALGFNNSGLPIQTATAVLPQMVLAPDIDSLIFTISTAATSSSDELSLSILTNCGQTSINLQTLLPNAADPAASGTGQFMPAPNHPWRLHRIDIKPILDNIGGGNFQLALHGRAVGGTNFYADNLKLIPVRIPQALKDKGYGIYPVPVGNQFSIWHLRPPTDLRGVSIFTATGQLLWQQNFSGNAPQIIRVNSTAWPQGVYLAHLIYQNNTVVEKLVK